MGFSEKDNIRRMGGNKVNTVGVLRAKFRRDGTINVEKGKRKRVFKGSRKRRDFKGRKKGLSERITAQEFETGTRTQGRCGRRIKKNLSIDKIANGKRKGTQKQIERKYKSKLEQKYQVKLFDGT